MIKVEDMNVVKCPNCKYKYVTILKGELHAVTYKCNECRAIFTKEYK